MCHFEFKQQFRDFPHEPRKQVLIFWAADGNAVHYMQDQQGDTWTPLTGPSGPRPAPRRERNSRTGTPNEPALTLNHGTSTGGVLPRRQIARRPLTTRLQELPARSGQRRGGRAY